MTPTLLWVFLLALVGRTASVPRPLTVDACALICNPGAETEAERERDPVLYPRYPKVNCRLQSTEDKDQAWVIASQCLKLCNVELSISMEVNCFALRSSLGANLGCFCEALSPLSPNTMRLHESWRLNFLVKELAQDILTVILTSDLDTLILCEIKQELFKTADIKSGKLYDKCKSHNESLLHDRSSRSVDEDNQNDSPSHDWESRSVKKDGANLPNLKNESENFVDIDNLNDNIMDDNIMDDFIEMEDAVEDVMEENTVDVKHEINKRNYPTRLCPEDFDPRYVESIRKSDNKECICKDNRSSDSCQCDPHNR